jgi:hypothetical protein
VVSRDDVMHGRAEPPVALLAPPPLAAQVPTGVCALDAERCPSRYVGGLSAQTQPAGVSRLCDELNAHMAIDEINTPQARCAEPVCCLLAPRVLIAQRPCCHELILMAMHIFARINYLLQVGCDGPASHKQRCSPDWWC